MLSLCHACSVTEFESDFILATNDAMLHKTLVTGEVYEISDHRCIIVERSCSVVQSRAVVSCRSFGREIGSVSGL